MARQRYIRDCPEWGPYHGHYYADEETGAYRHFCDCGQVDPSWRDPELVSSGHTSDPTHPNDAPPF